MRSFDPRLAVGILLALLLLATVAHPIDEHGTSRRGHGLFSRQVFEQPWNQKLDFGNTKVPWSRPRPPSPAPLNQPPIDSPMSDAVDATSPMSEMSDEFYTDSLPANRWGGAVPDELPPPLDIGEPAISDPPALPPSRVWKDPVGPEPPFEPPPAVEPPSIDHVPTPPDAPAIEPMDAPAGPINVPVGPEPPFEPPPPVEPPSIDNVLTSPAAPIEPMDVPAGPINAPVDPAAPSPIDPGVKFDPGELASNLAGEVGPELASEAIDRAKAPKAPQKMNKPMDTANTVEQSPEKVVEEAVAEGAAEGGTGVAEGGAGTAAGVEAGAGADVAGAAGADAAGVAGADAAGIAGVDIAGVAGADISGATGAGAIGAAEVGGVEAAAVGIEAGVLGAEAGAEIGAVAAGGAIAGAEVAGGAGAVAGAGVLVAPLGVAIGVAAVSLLGVGLVVHFWEKIKSKVTGIPEMSDEENCKENAMNHDNFIKRYFTKHHGVKCPALQPTKEQIAKMQKVIHVHDLDREDVHAKFPGLYAMTNDDPTNSTSHHFNPWELGAGIMAGHGPGRKSDAPHGLIGGPMKIPVNKERTEFTNGTWSKLPPEEKKKKHKRGHKQTQQEKDFEEGRRKSRKAFEMHWEDLNKRPRGFDERDRKIWEVIFMVEFSKKYPDWKPE